MDGEIIQIERGYGFIASPQCPRRIFFHRTAVTGADFTPELVGRRVQFTVGNDTGRGPRAERVEVLADGA